MLEQLLNPDAQFDVWGVSSMLAYEFVDEQKRVDDAGQRLLVAMRLSLKEERTPSRLILARGMMEHYWPRWRQWLSDHLISPEHWTTPSPYAPVSDGWRDELFVFAAELQMHFHQWDAIMRSDGGTQIGLFEAIPPEAPPEPEGANWWDKLGLPTGSGVEKAATGLTSVVVAATLAYVAVNLLRRR